MLVAERLAQLLLGDALQHDPRAEQHLPEARALLLEERDQTAAAAPSPASAARRHTSSAVHTPSVPSYLPPLRFESQCEPTPNAGAPGATLEAISVPTGSCQTVKPMRSSSAVK